MAHRFSNTLSSKNNTKYKVIPSHLNKFINHLMVDGKKGIAVEIFADSLRLFSRKLQEGKETPLLIKNQHESYFKNQTFLLDGRYRAPAFTLKPIWRLSGGNHYHCLGTWQSQVKKPSACSSQMSSTKMDNTFKSALQPCFDSIIHPFFLQRPGDNLLELAFYSPYCLAKPSACSSLLIKDQYQTSTALCNLRSTLLISGNGLGGQPTTNDYQHCPSLPLLGEAKHLLIKDEQMLRNLAETSKEAKHVLITDGQLRDGYKMGNDGLGQRVKEKTILPGKQHHFGKSNTPSPSLINCLEQALINVEPSLEVRKKKIAGITRQIPSTLSKSRGQGLAIRWIVESARGRRRKEGKRFSECLAEELVSAYHKKGEPRQKRDALHKLAESNRSFLRYRWW